MNRAEDFISCVSKPKMEDNTNFEARPWRAIRFSIVGIPILRQPTTYKTVGHEKTKHFQAQSGRKKQFLTLTICPNIHFKTFGKSRAGCEQFANWTTQQTQSIRGRDDVLCILIYCGNTLAKLFCIKLNFQIFRKRSLSTDCSGDGVTNPTLLQNF